MLSRTGCSPGTPPGCAFWTRSSAGRDAIHRGGEQSARDGIRAAGPGGWGSAGAPRPWRSTSAATRPSRPPTFSSPTRATRATACSSTRPGGPLAVEREGELLVLDFPSRPPSPCPAPDALARGLGRPPRAVLAARDWFCVYASAEEVAELRPDMALLAGLDRFGVIVTAPGAEGVDFVSRFFAPRDGHPGRTLSQDRPTAALYPTGPAAWAGAGFPRGQVSARGGELTCEDAGARVRIGGRAVTYLRGEIEA